MTKSENINLFPLSTVFIFYFFCISKNIMEIRQHKPPRNKRTAPIIVNEFVYPRRRFAQPSGDVEPPPRDALAAKLPHPGLLIIITNPAMNVIKDTLGKI